MRNFKEISLPQDAKAPKRMRNTAYKEGTLDAIIFFLKKFKTKEYTNLELSLFIGLERHTISKYLKELERKNLVTSRKIGNNVLWKFKWRC